MALVAVMLLMALLMAGGVSENAAAGVGLAVPVRLRAVAELVPGAPCAGRQRVRAAVLVLLINVATTVLIALPQLADYARERPAASP